ncbi:MAG: N-acetylneuraminate synthase family protein [bacterium]
MEKNNGIFDKLFIFEMANNHMGSTEHGLKIIRELNDARKNFNFKFAFKLQYRHLDTFIHPDYKDRMDVKYVKRFSETKLDENQFKVLKDEISRLGFISICTPFDETSVGLIEKHKFDIIKIGSCSFTDWPLLERIVKTNKPVIASIAGASLEEIDKVVSFFDHRNKNFALMHCVAEYPTKNNNLQLNQIDLIKSRYPHLKVGYSSHEHPDSLDSIKIVIAKGAGIFERHVGVRSDKINLNDYSSTPEQIHKWLEAAETAFEICGISGKRIKPVESEMASLQGLKRGVFAKRMIKKGEKIGPGDAFFAIPTVKDQITANDISKYTEFSAVSDIDRNMPLLLSNTKQIDNREKVYKIVQEIKKVIQKSGVFVPNKLDLEISHHYGIDRFLECGCTIINFVNREYCKKLIVLIPGQSHPEQYHKLKEETFYILSGEVNFVFDGKERVCGPGEIAVVERGVKHIFSSKTGAVIEEISSTHYKDDSYYTDKEILKNDNRKTLITYWVS